MFGLLIPSTCYTVYQIVTFKPCPMWEREGPCHSISSRTFWLTKPDNLYGAPDGADCSGGFTTLSVSAACNFPSMSGLLCWFIWRRRAGADLTWHLYFFLSNEHLQADGIVPTLERGRRFLAPTTSPSRAKLATIAFCLFRKHMIFRVCVVQILMESTCESIIPIQLFHLPFFLLCKDFWL